MKLLKKMFLSIRRTSTRPPLVQPFTAAAPLFPEQDDRQYCQNGHGSSQSVVPALLNPDRPQPLFVLGLQHGHDGLKILIDFGAMVIDQVDDSANVLRRQRPGWLSGLRRFTRRHRVTNQAGGKLEPAHREYSGIAITQTADSARFCDRIVQ